MDKTSYQRALSYLNEQQRQAVETIDGPVLVIAGPGTGKTQLLSVRIAHILDHTDTLPQNILCLTFTESAAKTMQQRLANLIGPAAYDVTISTYHAFGSELIRRYPEYFNADLNDARPIDELGMDQILRQIVAKLPYGNPLKFADNYIKDLKSLISDFKRALLTPDDVTKLAIQNQAFVDALNPLIKEALGGLVRIGAKERPRFEKLAVLGGKLSQSPKGNRPATGLASVIPLAESWQSELQTAIEEATDSTKPLTAWKNKWLAKDSQGQFVISPQNNGSKLAAAADIYDKYLKYLQKHGLYDYDDMILRAINGLESHTDLKFTLQEQYQYLLLDEFQDTNQAQFRLVELMTDNPVNEGRPNVLAVGDDDQAIFAFQGADYSHMLAFQRRYRDVLIVPLLKNYRSQASILRLADGIAGQIDERLQDNFDEINKKLEAVEQGKPKKATIQRHEFRSDVAQFAWVTNQIKRQVSNGHQAGQIAVLAPKHDLLEPLVPYLQQAGLPVRYEKRENILDDPTINQLVQMTSLVAALHNTDISLVNSLWPEVLSYDFWQAETLNIWQVGWQAHDQRIDWTELLVKQPKFKQIANFFIELSLGLNHQPLEQLLDYLIGAEPLGNYRSPFYDFNFGPSRQHSSRFWNLLTNLTILRQRLREYRATDDRPLTAQDFLDFVAAHRAADLKILNTSPYQESNNAVELMTAYKAKGQEFETVFILACSNQYWSASAGMAGSRISLPANLQYIRYGNATEDERRRLFFVALTRAKSQLFLTNFSQTFTGRTLSRLRYLSEVEAEDGQLVSPLLPAGSQIVIQNDSTPPAEKDLITYWQQRHLQANTDRPLRSLLQPRLDNYRLSATHLNNFTDTIYGGPQHFLINHLLHFPSSPTIEGQFGIAVHRTLEQISYFQREKGKLPSKRQLLDILQNQIKRLRLPTEQAKLLLERGQHSLGCYLEQKGGTFLATDRPEFNFRDEGVLVGQAHLSGTIDKLVIDKSSKTITVVDYKTGKCHQKWSRDARLHRYRLQLYLYKILVEGSHSFAGYTVNDAYLEFVEPDENGRVVDLHLKFDEKEMMRAKQLVKAVWQHITSANFPDISGYSSDLNGITQLQQDLIDGKI